MVSISTFDRIVVPGTGLTVNLFIIMNINDIR